MTTENSIDSVLSNIYYNLKNPACYSTFDTLWRVVRNDKKLNISKKDVKKWLQKQEAYTLHRNRILRFKRRCYNLTNIDDLWQIDLIDFQSLSRKNRGYKFILAVIDCFSKYSWCIPLKNKTSGEVTRAFEKIFCLTTRRPISVASDAGKEFLNTRFKTFLKTHEVNFYTMNDPATKASICERFIRTIKSIIFRYFTFKKTNVYIDVLDELVNIYNSKYHRTIKMSPADVNEKNILNVWINIQKSQKNYTDKKPLVQIGNFVRMAITKKIFDKGYRQKWSEEIFVVSKVNLGDPITYRLKDLHEGNIDGLFYEEEIQKITI